MTEHIRKLDTFSDDSFEIELELNEKSDTAVTMYINYMSEIMSAFVFFSKPGIQIDTVLPAIKDSAIKIVKMTKYFIEVSIKITASKITNYYYQLLIYQYKSKFMTFNHKAGELAITVI